MLDGEVKPVEFFQELRVAKGRKSSEAFQVCLGLISPFNNRSISLARFSSCAHCLM